MPATVTAVNPRLLVWARERSGRSIAEVAALLKKQPADISAWEAGEKAPTYAQLEALAYQVYKRPIALFFFPEPPDEPAPEHSFRTLPETEIEELSADTRFKIREARALQLSLYELNQGKNPQPALIFRDLPARGRPADQIAQEVRSYLSIDFSTQEAWRTPDEAFKAWRQAVEDKGVFVFKDAFKQGDISGFCLYDAEFPVISINNSTAAHRQIFTLFHELGHLLFATNGVTKADDSYIEGLQGDARRVEMFCNQFAANVLAPWPEVQRVAGGRAPTDEVILELSRYFKVSREVILRRFLDAGMVSLASYRAKARAWAEEARRARGSGGGNYYLNQFVYLGETYLRLAFRRFYEGAITLEQLADHLNVRPNSVAGLEQLLLERAPA
jgi:Zn-dependent peptidase ImmA (M78 family)